MESATLTGLSWGWITFAATVPALVGALIAYPFWRRREPILGNLFGTAVIFTTAFAMIWREHVELDRLVQGCLDEFAGVVGVDCWPSPAAFARFSLYASIALVEVFALFMLSLRIEERIRNRDYAPEWR